MEDKLKVPPPNPVIGNEGIAAELAGFDYSRLKEESEWFRYLDFTQGKLSNPNSKIEGAYSRRHGTNIRVGTPVFTDNALFDYEAYRAQALLDDVNPDDPNSKTYVTGLILKSTTPECTTRITAGRAKDLNSQVGNFTLRNPGLYYLLKKVTPKVAETEETISTTKTKNNHA